MTRNPQEIITADTMEAVGRKVVDQLVSIARQRIQRKDRAGVFLHIQQTFADEEYGRDYVGACLAAAVIALAEVAS